MASFFADLWGSIFTPGPTPTLLIATNAAFASLQALLFALLLATYSIHFLILSVLSGGLWWAINWFARELAAAQRAEDEAKRIRLAKARVDDDDDDGRKDETDWGNEAGDEKEEDTETETEVERGRKGAPGFLEPSAEQASGVSKGEGEGLVKRKSLSDAGELSTDSEWEKVDE